MEYQTEKEMRDGALKKLEEGTGKHGVGVLVNSLGAMRHYGDGSCIETLEGYIDHEKVILCGGAARALAAIGGDGSIELLKKMQADPRQAVKNVAADSLESIAAQQS